jgi:hypothetical protein
MLGHPRDYAHDVVGVHGFFHLLSGNHTDHDLLRSRPGAGDSGVVTLRSRVCLHRFICPSPLE